MAFQKLCLLSILSFLFVLALNVSGIPIEDISEGDSTTPQFEEAVSEETSSAVNGTRKDL